MKELVINEESAIYKIFNFPFHCRVPRHSLFTYEEIEKYGTYTTINETISANSLVDKIMTINEMVEFLKEGIVVCLAKPSESHKIYKIIMDHLRMWRDYGRDFGPPYDPPIEDLQYLNNLALYIFPIANAYGDEPAYEPNLFDLMTGVVPYSESDFDIETGHENILDEIRYLKENMGDYSRYGY